MQMIHRHRLGNRPEHRLGNRPEHRLGHRLGARRRPAALFMIAALFAALSAAALAAGCGAGDEPVAPSSPSPAGPARMSPVPSNAPYKPADVAFAQDMLGNLHQAIDLATLAEKRASNPEVKKLATQARQDREAGVVLLPMWLERYKQPLPPTGPPTGPGNASRPLGADDVATLTMATGTTFDKLFLQWLIKIDEAAAILLTGQQWSGISGPLMSLAHELESDEKIEMGTARRLLAG